MDANKDWLKRLSLLIFDSLDSTNNEAKNLSFNDNASEFIVWAKEQYSGRGRHNRTWVSEEGNLFFSLLLRPKMITSKLPQIAFISALAVGEALKKYVHKGRITYKWPNDVLVDGRKISGILIESNINSNSSKIDFVCVGIGVNLASFPNSSDIIFPAISLKDVSRKVIETKEVLNDIVVKFLTYYDEWIESGFSTFRQMWLEHAHFLGENISVITLSEKIEGKFIGITEEGNLKLQDKMGKELEISSGEILLGF